MLQRSFLFELAADNVDGSRLEDNSQADAPDVGQKAFTVAFHMMPNLEAFHRTFSD